MHNWVKFAEHEDQTSVAMSHVCCPAPSAAPTKPRAALQETRIAKHLFSFKVMVHFISFHHLHCVFCWVRVSSQMRRCSFMTLRFSRWYGLEEKTKTCPTMLTTQTVTYMHMIQLCTTYFGTRCCTWNLQTTASVIEVLLILAAEPQEMTPLQIDVGLLIWVRHNSPFLQ